MPEPSALSKEVRQYLASIEGAPDFFERFLCSGDFKSLQKFAKDFGGIEIVLPSTKYVLALNVFGVITFEPEYGVIRTISARGAAEPESEYHMAVREFISAIRKWVYPNTDSVWCTETLVQAVYESVAQKVHGAIARSRRE